MKKKTDQKAHLKVKSDGINRDHFAPCKVLKRAGKKSLREEETGNPEDRRNTIVHPTLNELKTSHKVSDPGRKWLQ